MTVRWSAEDLARHLRRGQSPRISEKAWQTAVMRLARQYGWMAYHTFDSRKSPSGYPDCTLVHPAGGRPLIYAELKADDGIVRLQQQAWLAALAGCTGVVAEVWKPSMLQEVVERLRS